MILEHAPFGRRGWYASFALQGVQAGQIFAAAVFLPLARYLTNETFNSWGWRIPFLLSLIVVGIGYVIRREVAETPAFVEEKNQRQIPRTPIVEAFKQSWGNMARVAGMSLMNTIPVVTTIFGAAYAVQPGYGVGFPRRCLPVDTGTRERRGGVRNPCCRRSLRQIRTPATDHRLGSAFGAALLRIPVCDPFA